MPTTRVSDPPALSTAATATALGAVTSTVSSQIRATGMAQVLVILKTPELSAAAALAETSIGDLEQYFVPSERSRVLASLATTSLALGTVTRKRKTEAVAPPLIRHFPALGVVLGTVDSNGLAGLQRDARVASVTGTPALSLIQPVRTAATAKTTQLGAGARLLNVQALWDAGFRGKGIVIAHLDTGVDGSHPVLKGAIADFAEFDLNGDEVPGAKPHDSGQHGTHTAATVAGRNFRGVFVGVAPETSLASALVIEGGEVVARVLAGLNWALGKGAKVLSMSLGLPGYHDDFEPLIQLIRTRGMLPVIAVGNEGPGTSRSPGNYAESLSVGACDNDKKIAYFSGSQTFVRTNDPLVPDLVGPGVDIISAVPGGGFMSMSGTSMATPHIAGLAALLFQAAPGATVNQVENAIFQSCSLAPGLPQNRANRGLPDAVKAFQILTGKLLSPTAASLPLKKTTTIAKKKGEPSSKKRAANRRRKTTSKSGRRT